MNQTQSRPLRAIPWDERKQILLELEIERTKDVRTRHNISNQVISHLRWHYGKTKHDGFHKDLVGDEKPALLTTIGDLKREGLNSQQIAERLHLSLGRVNMLWPKI